MIQPYADAIVAGVKFVECRNWRTTHRGGLVICSTERPEMPGLLCGYALGVVELIGIVPFEPRLGNRPRPHPSLEACTASLHLPRGFTTLDGRFAAIRYRGAP